jgi:Recombination endonuclease VII
VPRPRESDEHKRQMNARRQRMYRATHPLTAEEKAQNRARNKVREQTPEYKAWAAAKYRARRESLASHPRPDLCEVCGRPPNGKGTLHLDHCHTTKAFRGWLCHYCNFTLGAVEDNPDILRKLIDYLERFPRLDGEYVPQRNLAERKHEPLEPLPLLDGL